MSFKSVLGKVGKVALKVAPIAAMAIPGVGPLASMAIGGIANAASKKLEGGSWKSALGSGAIGAGMGYLGGAAKGLGPSGDVMKVANAATKGGKAASILGGITKGVSLASPILGAIGEMKSGGSSSGQPLDSTPSGHSSGGLGPSGGVMPRGGYHYNEDPMNQVDQSSPNLAQSIFQGRQQAIANQPFRGGYNILGAQPDATDAEPNPQRPVLSRMPRIQSNASGGRRKIA